MNFKRDLVKKSLTFAYIIISEVILMVMYEDYCKGKLFLKYENTPSANEVIRDVLNAPIESGETFQNKKKGMLVINDKYIVVLADLGPKAEEQVLQEIADARPNWKAVKVEGKLGFELPEAAESEQKDLMGI